MLRQRSPLLVVGHQAILRVLYGTYSFSIGRCVGSWRFGHAFGQQPFTRYHFFWRVFFPCSCFLCPLIAAVVYYLWCVNLVTGIVTSLLFFLDSLALVYVFLLSVFVPSCFRFFYLSFSFFFFFLMCFLLPCLFLDFLFSLVFSLILFPQLFHC